MRAALFFSLLICLFWLSTPQQAFAQDGYTREEDTGNEEESEPYAQMHLGFSTGINNQVGVFGIQFGYALNSFSLLECGLGMGGWGPKGSINYQYHPFQFNRLYVKGGISCSTGGKDIDISLPDANDDPQIINFDLLPSSNLNFLLGNSKKFGKRGNRFYIEAGWSFKLRDASNPWVLNTPGVVLSNIAETSLRFTSPGGLILALGLNFGLSAHE